MTASALMSIILEQGALLAKTRSSRCWEHEKKTEKKDVGLYQERHFGCWKLWILKTTMNSNQCHAYELAWEKLEKQGYPRCLQTATVCETIEVQVPKNDGENDVSTMDVRGEEPNNTPKPPPSVTPSKRIRPNGSMKDSPASNQVQDVSTELQAESKNTKHLAKRLPVSAVERLMVTRLSEENPVIRTLQQENESLRNLVMEAVAKLHQREHMPVLQSSFVGASTATVPTTSPDAGPATTGTRTNTVTADDDERHSNKTREPTVADLQEYLNPTKCEEDDDIETSYFRKIYGPAYARKENDAAAYQR